MNILYLVTKSRPFFQNQVMSIRQRGHSVTVVDVPGMETQRDSRGVSDYIRYYPDVLSESLRDYDVVHANYGLTLPFAILQPVRPVVVTFWGSDLMGELSTLIKPFAKAADEVILPSQTLADYYDGEYTYIPFGVDPELFRPIDKQEAREQLGWDQDATIALFPYAQNRAVKNYSLAKRIVSSSSYDIQLKTIHSVEYDQMPLYMNASDVVLITSRRESGPLVVKEAGLCNVPVVSTNVGFVAGVLSDVAHSFVCNSDRELKERLEHVVGSKPRSDGREKLIGTCSLDMMGRNLCDVYEHISSPS